MGRRENDLVNDMDADAQLHQLLEQFGEPRLLDPPPDLVSRTLRRLPTASPIAQARSAARTRTIQWALLAVVGVLVVLIALTQFWSALGFGPSPVYLFGDGSGGLSQTLLLLQLLTKPLLGSLGAAGPQNLAAGTLLLLVSAGLWWWLVQRTPVYVVAEGQ